MNDVNKELLNDNILIKMLENLEFTEVKEVSISCITGYKVKFNDKNEKYVQSLGYDIRID